MRRLVLTLALVAAMVLSVSAQNAPPVASQSTTLLPKAFAGWQKGEAQTTNDPLATDPTHAEVLKEFRFAQSESAAYGREDRKITIKAIRFEDATGAYGAFTIYREPQMLTEQIGDISATHNARIMFMQGAVLVQAQYDRVTAMTAGELRELASMLPQPPGPAKNLPTLPAFLPRQTLEENSARFVVGPQGLAAIGAPIGAELVNFDTGAELMTGAYRTPFGIASLTLISYPTPAIAGDRQRAIESAGLQGVYTKRSGPLVALVTGRIGEDDARALLASVNYDANITWNERSPTAKDNPVDLLLNEAKLVGIVLSSALLAGLLFGVIRIIVKKKYPGKVFDRPEQMEIIQLNIRD